jgi:hypothetical protein
VVSHDFGMQEWRPDAQETVPAPDKTVGFRKESAVYLWVVPARVEGDWSLEIVSRDRVRTIPLALRQEFQMVSGSVKVPAKESVPVSDGRLRGDELRLALPGGVLGDDPVLLVGRVAGDSLRGSVRRGEREIATWSARRQP